MGKKDERWILDSREKNRKLLELVKNRDNWKPGESWEIRALKLHEFVIPPEDKKHIDICDLTNDNKDGLVEFKDFGDFIGTFGGKRGKKQVHDMHSTGFPFAVIIHGNEWVYRKRTKRAPDWQITVAKREILTLQAIYKFAVPPFCRDIYEALELGKTFLRHCREVPKGPPIWNAFKGKEDIPVACLCGLPIIGPERARMILEFVEAQGFPPTVPGVVLYIEMQAGDLGKSDEEIFKDIHGFDKILSAAFIEQLYTKYKRRESS